MSQVIAELYDASDRHGFMMADMEFSIRDLHALQLSIWGPLDSQQKERLLTSEFIGSFLANAGSRYSGQMLSEMDPDFAFNHLIVCLYSNNEYDENPGKIMENLRHMIEIAWGVSTKEQKSDFLKSTAVERVIQAVDGDDADVSHLFLLMKKEETKTAHAAHLFR